MLKSMGYKRGGSGPELTYPSTGMGGKVEVDLGRVATAVLYLLIILEALKDFEVCVNRNQDLKDLEAVFKMIFKEDLEKACSIQPVSRAQESRNSTVAVSHGQVVKTIQTPRASEPSIRPDPPSARSQELSHDQSHVQSHGPPSQGRSHDLSHEPPPLGRSHGLPPQGRSHGLPPQGQSHGLPPQGRSHGLPPQGRSHGLPPQGRSHGLPPQGWSHGLPPQGRSHGLPPQGRSHGLPPQGRSHGLPPQGQSHDPSHEPPPQGRSHGLPQGKLPAYPHQGNEFTSDLQHVPTSTTSDLQHVPTSTTSYLQHVPSSTTSDLQHPNDMTNLQDTPVPKPRPRPALRQMKSKSVDSEFNSSVELDLPSPMTLPHPYPGIDHHLDRSSLQHSKPRDIRSHGGSAAVLQRMSSLDFNLSHHSSTSPDILSEVTPFAKQREALMAILGSPEDSLSEYFPPTPPAPGMDTSESIYENQDVEKYHKNVVKGGQEQSHSAKAPIPSPRKGSQQETESLYTPLSEHAVNQPYASVIHRPPPEAQLVHHTQQHSPRSVKRNIENEEKIRHINYDDDLPPERQPRGGGDFSLPQGYKSTGQARHLTGNTPVAMHLTGNIPVPVHLTGNIPVPVQHIDYGNDESHLRHTGYGKESHTHGTPKYTPDHVKHQKESRI